MGMVYLPTFTFKNQPNVGKSTMHVSLWDWVVVSNIFFLLFTQIPGEDGSNLTDAHIFFKWVGSTTNEQS